MPAQEQYFLGVTPSVPPITLPHFRHLPCTYFLWPPARRWECALDLLVRGVSALERLKDIFFSLFRRTDEEAPASERPAQEETTYRDIKGAIFALLGIFQLVALTSYVPLDSLNLFEGRLDHMLNLGGIVGAAIAQLFLGTVGLAGYFLVAITFWFSFCAFRGIHLGKYSLQITGALLGTFFTALALALTFAQSTPDISLLQGGWVGRHVGSWLSTYFNSTGAGLIVAGGFLVTGLMTTGFSLVGTWRKLSGETEEEEIIEEKPRAKPATRAVAAPTAKVVPISKAAAKPRRKKAAKAETGDSQAATETTDENGEAITPEVVDGETPDTAVATELVFEEVKPFSGTYSLPSTRLIKNSSTSGKKLTRSEIRESAQALCEHLLSFQITGEVVAVSQGPVLTTYEFKPSAGIKLSKIAGLQDDLGVVLGTRDLRIMAPIPGKTVVGIEVAKPHPETISLKEILSEKSFYDKKIKIPVALGKSTDGKPLFGDLTAMPHLLVAGATGSGKSVFINSLIMSFIYRLSPQELRLILIDPKMLELNVFDGIPHLITNVITNNNVAHNALNWAVIEMERRYSLMAETGSKNIDSFNAKVRGPEKLPYIVIVVDELADLMMSGGETTEIAITRLAQKARAAGIHLVLATQRPSTDVVTGLIKANIPSRLSFKVPSAIDSRTVLDTSGAEDLIGRGDSLMIQPAAPLRRIHGCFVTEEDLARVVKYVKGGKDHSKNYIQFPATKFEKE